MSNRVQSWLEEIPGLAAEEFALRDSLEANESLPHVLFSPLHYEAKYAYPLLIWLHRSGQDERQLLDVMPLLSLRNYVAIAPRGIALGDEGRAEELGWPADSAATLQAESLVFGCLQRAQHERQVSPRRIFLGGEGDGGTMAIRIALANPRTFAGVVSVEGPLPKGNKPFAHVAEARDLPIWLAAGRDSNAYPVDEVCADLRLLHTAGMQITLRQYPSGASCMALMLADLNPWLMEIVCGAAK